MAMYCLLCSERDEFDKQLGDLQKQHAYLDTTHQAIVKERDELAAEVCILTYSLNIFNLFNFYLHFVLQTNLNFTYSLFISQFI